VWELGGPIGGRDEPVDDFAEDANWAAALEFSEPPFNSNALVGTGTANLYVAKPQSYTEEALMQPYSLNPDDLATGAGLFYYRVTGRGFGGNDTAQSVVQSTYLQRFR
jgi:Tfp pilus assembly protein PilX